jgi:hypothetical protein
MAALNIPWLVNLELVSDLDTKIRNVNSHASVGSVSIETAAAVFARNVTVPIVP